MSDQWPSLIVLVRHGESEGNLLSDDDRNGSKKPNKEFTLTERGHAQAAIVGRYIRDTFGWFDYCFTSSYIRTKQTMDSLCPINLADDDIEDLRLDEWWKGIFYEMNMVALTEIYPHEVEVKERVHPYHYRPPRGESGEDVQFRIESLMREWKSRFAGKKLLIAAHGRWLQLFKIIVQGARYDALDQNQRVANCSLTVCKPHSKDPSRLFLYAFAWVPEEVRNAEPELFPSKP